MKTEAATESEQPQNHESELHHELSLARVILGISLPGAALTLHWAVISPQYLAWSIVCGSFLFCTTILRLSCRNEFIRMIGLIGSMIGFSETHRIFGKGAGAADFQAMFVTFACSATLLILLRKPVARLVQSTTGN